MNIIVNLETQINNKINRILILFPLILKGEYFESEWWDLDKILLIIIYISSKFSQILIGKIRTFE